MSRPHHATAHRIIDLLARRTQPGPAITNPDAWRRTVRNDLRTRHWPTLLAILDPTHDDHVRTIADLLEPRPEPAPEPPNPSATLPFVGPDWPRRTPDGLEADDARQRLEQIRSGLTTSAPRPSRRHGTTSDWHDIAVALYAAVHSCDAAEVLTDEQQELVQAAFDQVHA